MWKAIEYMKKEKKIFKNDWKEKKMNNRTITVNDIILKYMNGEEYELKTVNIYNENMFNFWAEIMLEEKCVLKLCTVYNAVFASIYDDTDVYILKSKMKLKKEWFDKYDFAVPDVIDIVYKKLLKITEI